LSVDPTLSVFCLSVAVSPSGTAPDAIMQERAGRMSSPDAGLRRGTGGAAEAASLSALLAPITDMNPAGRDAGRESVGVVLFRRLSGAFSSRRPLRSA